MKRILVILIALAALAAFSVPAFADCQLNMQTGVENCPPPGPSQLDVLYSLSVDYQAAVDQKNVTPKEIAGAARFEHGIAEVASTLKQYWLPGDTMQTMYRVIERAASALAWGSDPNVTATAWITGILKSRHASATKSAYAGSVPTAITQ